MAEPQPTPKNAWMEKLSVESWQAELVISGVAIYGSFQLMDQVHSLVDYLYFRLPEELMGFAYFLCFYLLITATILCFSFLLHFALRALWIANIGLASVYPHGIKRDNTLFTPHFMDQLLGRFPSFNQFNEDLDKICSSLLASALTIVLSLSGIGVLLGVILLLSYIFAQFLPPGLSAKIFFGVILLIVAAIFFSSVLNAKSLRDKAWVHRIQFPITMAVGGYLFGNIFYKPIFYLMYTIRTNIDPRRYWSGFVAFLVFVFLVTVTQISTSHLFLFLEPVYRRYDMHTDRIYAGNYEDQLSQQGRSLIRPTIPSEFIDNPNQLRLFLPMPEREEGLIFASCGDFTEPENMSSDSVRILRYAFRIDCFRDHLQLELNGRPLTEYTLRMHRHRNQNEPGLLFFFPVLELQPGENILTVHHFWRDPDDRPKIDRIPFWYTGQ